MGRISVSIGRRLGEIYEKIPRFIAAARFGLDAKDVSPKLHGLELDIGLELSKTNEMDKKHIANTVKAYVRKNVERGVGIEVRYNFNPNDSARLRKDVDMVNYLREERYLPIYLVFSSISPRGDAISRLRRAGWNFLIGNQAIEFSKDLFGLDLGSILTKRKVKANIRKEVNEIMKDIYSSYAFSEVLKKYS